MGKAQTLERALARHLPLVVERAEKVAPETGDLQCAVAPSLVFAKIRKSVPMLSMALSPIEVWECRLSSVPPHTRFGHSSVRCGGSFWFAVSKGLRIWVPLLAIKASAVLR